MRKVFLHFRLGILLLAAFLYFSLVQVRYSFACLFSLFSYKKSLRWLDTHVHRNGRVFCNLVRLILGINLQVPLIDTFRNTCNIDFHKPYIVLSNHQSLIDIMIIAMAFQIPIRFVAKKVLGRYIPHISKVNRAYHNALIDRKSGMKTIGDIKNLSRRCRRYALPMVIFPEGTRSRSGDVHTFHSVGIKASLLDGPMDIIVIALDGGLFFPKMFIFPDTKNERCIYLKVLHVFENVTRNSAKQYVKKAEELIRDQVVRWREEHGIQFPITEYTHRRQRVQ